MIRVPERKEKMMAVGGGGVSDTASEMAKSPIVCSGVTVCVRARVCVYVSHSVMSDALPPHGL